MFTIDIRPASQGEGVEYFIRNSRPGYGPVDAPSFPGTLEGKRDANRIARLLNDVVADTRRGTQRAIRSAIGL